MSAFFEHKKWRRTFRRCRRCIGCASLFWHKNDIHLFLDIKNDVGVHRFFQYSRGTGEDRWCFFFIYFWFLIITFFEDFPKIPLKLTVPITNTSLRAISITRPNILIFLDPFDKFSVKYLTERCVEKREILNFHIFILLVYSIKNRLNYLHTFFFSLFFFFFFFFFFLSNQRSNLIMDYPRLFWYRICYGVF